MPRTPVVINEPLLPRWLRRTLVVIAALLMCSCRAIDAPAQTIAEPSSEPAFAAEPAACVVEDCPGPICQPGACDAGACSVDGCPCCQPNIYPGPGDEYLCDGGDRGFSAAVAEGEAGEAIVGLEQEDTIAHYSRGHAADRRKRIAVTPSNRVCIYAPRFGAVRRVLSPRGATQRTFVDAVGDLAGASEAELNLPPSSALQNVALLEQARDQPPGLYRGRQQLGATVRLRKPADALAPVPVYANLQLMHAGELAMSERPVVAKLALAAATWTGDQELQIAISGQAASALFDAKQPGLIYHTDEPDTPRLRLVKCASTGAAHPGDEIGFTLRVDNLGDAPASDVVVVDNLTTRLEYVEGSAESSLDADFTTARNGAGSLVLRWQLDEPLKPGEGAVLTFRTRVR